MDDGRHRSQQQKATMINSPTLRRRFVPFQTNKKNDEELLHFDPSVPVARRRTTSRSFEVLTAIGVILALVPWINEFRLQRQAASMKNNLLSMIAEQEKMIQSMEATMDTVRANKEEARKLEESNKALVQELAKYGDTMDWESNFYAEAEEMEDKYLTRIDELESAIRKYSERTVRRKYNGVGPFRIRVTLAETKGSFVIQTARLDFMPHSIHHFLKMVELKLWDGLSLYHKNEVSSVIHAFPMEAQTGQRHDERFRAANVTKLVFAEHHELQPIGEKYAVAFHGRPGGPDFYINMEDGFRTHEVDERESCFGKVTEGRHVLDAIMAEDKAGRAFLSTIESMRLIQ